VPSYINVIMVVPVPVTDPLAENSEVGRVKVYAPFLIRV
jgi:hypothetical protein